MGCCAHARFQPMSPALPPKAPKTRRERQAETRQQVIAAGRKLFLGGGYHRTTLAAVVEAAGFTKGAVYSNFSNKAELAFAVVEEIERENVARLAEAYAGVDGPAARGAVLKAWGETLLDDVDLIRLRAELNFEALDDPKLAGVLRQKSRNTRATVAALLRETADTEALLLEVDALADVLVALANGVGMLRLLDPEFDLQRFVDAEQLLTGAVAPQPGRKG